MARIGALLLLLVALICAHLCSANQNTPNNHQNNQDPCKDPTSPQYNRVVPWREVDYTDSRFVLPRFDPVNVTDTTGCVMVRLFDFSVYQSGNPQNTSPFSATMGGNVYNLCGGQTYSFQTSQYEGQQLNIPSIEIQSAILEPLTLTGSYYNGSFSDALTITTDRAYFDAIYPPYSKSQEELVDTDEDSQCKTRLRYDEAINIVYSRPFHLTATLGNGQVHSFTFPANVAATAYYYHYHFFYQQCTCANSASASVLLRPSTPSTLHGFPDPRA